MDETCIQTELDYSKGRRGDVDNEYSMKNYNNNTVQSTIWQFEHCKRVLSGSQIMQSLWILFHGYDSCYWIFMYSAGIPNEILYLV